MKKYILTLIIGLLTFSVSNAQGNLQFSQVINGTYISPSSLTGFTKYTIGTIVVPAGKVLKIESGSVTSDGSFLNLGSGRATIGGQLIWAYSGSSIYIYDTYPIWLSEGSHDVVYYPTTNSSTAYKVDYSAIEFNIIP